VDAIGADAAAAGEKKDPGLRREFCVKFCNLPTAELDSGRVEISEVFHGGATESAENHKPQLPSF
jgi:hypothetical protein